MLTFIPLSMEYIAIYFEHSFRRFEPCEGATCYNYLDNGYTWMSPVCEGWCIEINVLEVLNHVKEQLVITGIGYLDTGYTLSVSVLCVTDGIFFH